jgi:hypothetical protein
VFIRHGDLPDDTAAFIDELYKDRLQADYELASFDADTTADEIVEVRERIEDFSDLL